MLLDLCIDGRIRNDCKSSTGDDKWCLEEAGFLSLLPALTSMGCDSPQSKEKHKDFTIVSFESTLKANCMKAKF